MNREIVFFHILWRNIKAISCGITNQVTVTIYNFRKRETISRLEWDRTLHLNIFGGNKVPSLQALRFWIFNRTSLIVTADTRGCCLSRRLGKMVDVTEIGLWATIRVLYLLLTFQREKALLSWQLKRFSKML